MALRALLAVGVGFSGCSADGVPANAVNVGVDASPGDMALCAGMQPRWSCPSCSPSFSAAGVVAPGGAIASAALGCERPESLLVVREAGADASAVDVWRRGAGGAIGLAFSVSTGAGACDGTLAVAELDGDGVLDVALACGAEVRVFRGTADGGLVAGEVLASDGAKAVGLPQAADLDGDGRSELCVPVYRGTVDSSAVRCYRRGLGGLVALPELSLGKLGSFVLRDFDGDGAVDLLATTVLGGGFLREARFLKGDGRGHFSPERVLDGLTAGVMVPVDVNRDGVLDLCTADTVVMLGNGDGTFRRGPMRPVAGLPLVAADFDGDGQVDVAFGDGDSLVIAATAADGVLRPVGQRVRVGGMLVYGAVTPELDGDGRPDLVVSSVLLGGAARLRNVTQ